jgi:hypothetical protein
MYHWWTIHAGRLNGAWLKLGPLSFWLYRLPAFGWCFEVCWLNRLCWASYE